MSTPPAFQSQDAPKPLPFDPSKLKGLSEQMIRSHWENNYGGSVKALARLPLPTLAQVLGVSPDELQLRLRQQGLEVEQTRQSLQELVGADTRAQARALNRLLAASR